MAVTGTMSKNPICINPPTFRLQSEKYDFPRQLNSWLDKVILYCMMAKVTSPIGSNTFQESAKKADIELAILKSFTNRSPLYGRPRIKNTPKI